MFRKLHDLLSNDGIERWAIQAVFIVLAVLLSILCVTWILEKSLVKNALELEADAFIESYRQDPAFPLPRTRNLIGYLQSSEANIDIPSELILLDTGLHPDVLISGRTDPVPVYVRDFDSHRLFLIFEGANIDRLVGIFGLVPLTTLLIVIYFSSWIAYRLSWRAISPVLSIAQTIRSAEPEKSKLHLPLKHLSGDTKELAMALEEYESRITAFVNRERQFTADVSHELRTPITIIDAAAQILRAEKQLSQKGYERVSMIRRACHDVNELIQAFFLLAREAQPEMNELTDVSEVVRAEVSTLQHLQEYKNIQFNVSVCFPLKMTTPRKVIEIILGNIVKNAAKYTEEGTVTISIESWGVNVQDDGPGIEEGLLPYIFDRHTRGRGHMQAGEGIGLAIVKRLCDQFGWQILIQNAKAGGVNVALKYAP